GQYRGVTVELGSAIAKKLGVPVEFVPHLASGEIQNSADANRWDVTFMPVDEERKKFVDFGNAYYLLQSTYLVAPGAKPAKIEDVNESGCVSAVSRIPRLCGRPSGPRPRRPLSQCRVSTSPSPL
ncbi:MAG: transporter substrate-binding domain-containing protein, partial [Pseudolabrys sp.]